MTEPVKKEEPKKVDAKTAPLVTMRLRGDEYSKGFADGFELGKKAAFDTKIYVFGFITGGALFGISIYAYMNWWTFVTYVLPQLIGG